MQFIKFFSEVPETDPPLNMPEAVTYLVFLAHFTRNREKEGSLELNDVIEIQTDPSTTKFYLPFTIYNSYLPVKVNRRTFLRRKQALIDKGLIEQLEERYNQMALYRILKFPPGWVEEENKRLGVKTPSPGRKKPKETEVPEKPKEKPRQVKEREQKYRELGLPPELATDGLNRDHSDPMDRKKKIDLSEERRVQKKVNRITAPKEGGRKKRQTMADNLMRDNEAPVNPETKEEIERAFREAKEATIQ